MKSNTKESNMLYGMRHYFQIIKKIIFHDFLDICSINYIFCGINLIFQYHSLSNHVTLIKLFPNHDF